MNIALKMLNDNLLDEVQEVDVNGPVKSRLSSLVLNLWQNLLPIWIDYPDTIVSPTRSLSICSSYAMDGYVLSLLLVILPRIIHLLFKVNFSHSTGITLNPLPIHSCATGETTLSRDKVMVQHFVQYVNTTSRLNTGCSDQSNADSKNILLP